MCVCIYIQYTQILYILIKTEIIQRFISKTTLFSSKEHSSEVKWSDRHSSAGAELNRRIQK